jgi:hypothetical protein
MVSWGYRRRDVFLIQPGRAGHAAMSLGFNVSELLESIQRLEKLTKARLAERRKGADTVDSLRTQLVRYGVCTCSCHFTLHTTHTGDPCCGNARVAKK